MILETKKKDTFSSSSILRICVRMLLEFVKLEGAMARDRTQPWLANRPTSLSTTKINNFMTITAPLLILSLPPKLAT